MTSEKKEKLVRVSAILNLTPDSFSDGGQVRTAVQIDSFLTSIVSAGVCEADIGACSTRPGAAEVGWREELRRLEPLWDVMESYRDSIVFSIDSWWQPVIQKALEHGLSWVNDVSCAVRDSDLLPFVAEAGCGYIVMHNRGTPATMNAMQDYAQGIDTVLDEMDARLGSVFAAGIDDAKLRIDPGLGFAKDSAMNLQIVRQIDRFRRWKLPLYVGPSRKRFVGYYSDVKEARDRDAASLAIAGYLADKGVETIRMHAAPETIAYLKMRRTLSETW